VVEAGKELLKKNDELHISLHTIIPIRMTVEVEGP
jgi:hypothetical protein